jgi:hypothetical protein
MDSFHDYKSNSFSSYSSYNSYNISDLISPLLSLKQKEENKIINNNTGSYCCCYSLFYSWLNKK